MKKTLLLLGLLGGFAVSAIPIKICNNLNNLSTVSEKTEIKKAVDPIRNGYRLIINYQDNYGNINPLRDLYVEVHQIIGQYEWTVQTGYTSHDGTYDFVNLDSTYQSGNSGMFYFKVFSKGHGYNVKDETGNVYVWESEPYTYFHYATYRTDQTFHMGETLGRYFALTQVVRIGCEYAKFMNNDRYLETCDVIYPVSRNVCCYESFEKRILLSGLDDPKSPQCIYEDFDVVLHEYGHHVQHEFNWTMNPAGTHYFGYNHQDYLYEKYIKEYVAYDDIISARSDGLHLAYAEGWATAFGLLAQRHFKDEFINSPYYADSKFSDYIGFEIDYNTYPVCLGEGSEDSIVSLIWNMFDEDDDNDPVDQLSENETLFKACSKDAFTISDYVNNYRRIKGSNNAFNKLLAKLKMSPSYIIPVKILYRNESPVFKWDCDSGSKYFKNNRFIFHIESELQDHIAKYSAVVEKTPGVDTVMYTVPYQQWQHITTTGADYFTVYVEAYCENFEFNTGAYSTPEYTFRVPKAKKTYSDSVMFESMDWKFPQKYDWTEMSSTVDNNEYYFNTRRLRTGCIENDQIVLSAKKKNAGEAYFEVTTDYMIHDVEFDVSLWSNSEGIKPSNSEIKVEVLMEDGEWHLEYDLWNDVTLPTNKNDTLYLVTDTIGFYGIRWSVTAPATGSHNNGRLVLKDIIFNI